MQKLEQVNLVKFVNVESAKMSDNPDGQGEEEANTNPPLSNAGHPLLNPVVASSLFEVVRLPELRTLRLVCKDWHSLSLPRWRRTVQIIIHDKSSNEQLLQWKSLGTELDFAGEQPFRNFRLHLPQFLDPNSKPCINTSHMCLSHESLQGKYRNMERFWANYGIWIYKLELWKACVADVDAFKRAIFEQTPNLQELILNQLTGSCDTGSTKPLTTQANEDEGPAQPNLNLKAFTKKHHTKLPFGWSVFFTRFPNIQKLEFAETSAYKPPDSDEMVVGVENMLMNPARRPNLPITDLRLEVVVRLDGAVEKLLRNPLVKLKVLHLRVHGKSAENLDLLKRVMCHHGNTLKELHLQHDEIHIGSWESVGGPYVSLTELQMKGAAFALNFHFLDKFPNLKVLGLEQPDDDEMLMNTNWTALKRMPQLREFYFIVTDTEELADDILSEETLERLAEVMPNLECFTGQLTNMTLRLVCRNWRKLKKLAILSGWNYSARAQWGNVRDILDIDDVGITGVVPRSDERVPCVADLQELCHLTLQHVTRISDDSVFDGFLKLPRLSSLDICDETRILMGLEPLRRRLQGGLTITPFF